MDKDFGPEVEKPPSTPRSSTLVSDTQFFPLGAPNSQRWRLPIAAFCVKLKATLLTP